MMFDFRYDKFGKWIRNVYVFERWYFLFQFFSITKIFLHRVIFFKAFIQHFGISWNLLLTYWLSINAGIINLDLTARDFIFVVAMRVGTYWEHPYWCWQDVSTDNDRIHFRFWISLNFNKISHINCTPIHPLRVSSFKLSLNFLMKYWRIVRLVTI